VRASQDKVLPYAVDVGAFLEALVAAACKQRLARPV